LSLRPEEEAALAQSVQGKPIDFWQHVLRQNPFWFWGREYLANLAEKEEQFAVAILLRYELAFWRRRLRDYENFFALEQYGTSEHQHLFAKARVNFESIRKIQNDLNYRKYKFREIKNSHDRFLFRLYDKALREQQFINN
ncbi:MAG: hypothetical protein IK079_04425, partial [Desulfovibrio sp.]|nr:hypothetical protein [Desulfovibrio sp.]